MRRKIIKEKANASDSRLQRKTPFIYTMPEYESVLLIQDSKGKVQKLDVNIHFLEKEDKSVSTIITASENRITDAELKKLVTQSDYPT